MRLWLIRIVILFFFLLPALSVNNSSDMFRVVAALIFFTMCCLIISYVESKPLVPEKESEWEKKRRIFSEKYQKYVWLCFGVSFVIAEIVSIAATYGDAGIVGPLGRAIISIGERLFPVVNGYATLMEPPLSAGELFRVQTTVSAFYIAVLVVSSAYVAYVVSGPADEFIAMYYVEPMSFLMIIWTTVAFLLAIAFAAAFIFGWFDFWGGSSCKRKGGMLVA
ncbi:hypothetical protein AB4144_39070, partial [Rhizobiaceae sp. 2RAB30]